MFAFLVEAEKPLKINIMKALSILLLAAVLLTSCASTTMIQSNPPGAEVYIENMKMGTTPYYYTDTKIVGSTTEIKLKKEGYKDFSTVITRDERADVGAIVGGCFLLVPFLWTMEYNPIHQYDLQAGKNQNASSSSSAAGSNQNDQLTNELIKLKSLLDQNAITPNENTALKSKILNNDYDYNNSMVEQIIKYKKLLDAKLLSNEEYNAQKNKLLMGN